MSETRALPSPEDLRELRSRGIIFSSPRAVRLTVTAALAAVTLWIASRALVPPSQTDLADLSRFVTDAAAIAALLAALTIVVISAVSLILNGFFVSAQMLALRRQERARNGLFSTLGALGLGLAVGLAAFYAMVRTLFGLLYLTDGATGQAFGSVLDGLARGGQRVATGIIVGSLFLAILVAGVARCGFLLRHRVPKSPSS